MRRFFVNIQQLRRELFLKKRLHFRYVNLASRKSFVSLLKGEIVGLLILRNLLGYRWSTGDPVAQTRTKKDI